MKIKGVVGKWKKYFRSVAQCKSWCAWRL